VILFQLHERAHYARRGVVHQYVQAAELPVDFGKQFFDFGHIAHVCLHQVNADTQGFQLRRCFPGGRAVAQVVEHQVISLFRQSTGDRLSDPAGSARNERHFSVCMHEGFLLSHQLLISGTKKEHSHYTP
jgi:hypothetical protein